MSQKSISKLRRRMLEDMAVRKFSEATIGNYIRHITEFANFLGCSPDTPTAVAQLSIGLSSLGISPASTTQGHCLACSRSRR